MSLRLSRRSGLLGAALWLLSSGAAAPAPAGDEEAALQELAPDDEGYVVWGRPVEPSGVAVEEQTRRELERRGATDVAEALEASPAVMVSSGGRGERTLTLRGFDQRQTLVLVDGVPAYMPYDGQLDLAMLPAEMVDHITVVKGPSALLLGPNGLGGAVNIVTRKPGQGPFLEARAEVAGAEQGRAAAYHSLRLGPVAYALYGGLDQRDAWTLSRRFVPTRREDGGQRLNSDKRMVHAGADVGVLLSDAHALRASALYLDGAHGVPPSLVERAPRYWRFSAWRLLGASAAHEGRVGDLELQEHLFGRQVGNTLDSYDDDTYSSQQSARGFRSTYDDAVLGGGLRARWPLAPAPWLAVALRGYLGLQHDRHDEESEGDLPQQTVARTLVSAAPLFELYLLEDWQLTAATQLDLELADPQSSDGAAPPVGLGPLLSLRYQPLDRLWLGLSAARRTRFPTLKERFTHAFGARVANHALAPESAWHLGLDADWRPSPRLVLAASLFDAEVQDLIELVQLGDGRDQMQNVGAARLLGAEAELALVAARGLEVRLGYAWLWARRVDADPPDDQLDYRPEHKAFLGTVATPLPWLELSSQLRLVGAQSATDPVSLDRVRLHPYAVWDARLAVRPLDQVELWARASNLLDVSYQSQIGYPAPGRTLWLGLRLWAGDALGQDLAHPF